MIDADTVVVGGGLAGLSLARRLHRAGIDYLLLEARDRLGGRVLSQAIESSEYPDERHDLGPSWIWPGQPRIAALTRELGLRVFSQYSDGKLVYEDQDGNVRRDLDYATMAGSLRIERGVASVIDSIARALERDKIRLSRTVTKVTRAAGGFLLNVVSPEGESTVHANRLVLALPPRLVEKTIAFDAPLPRSVTEALRAVPTWMAGHAKLVAVYEQPFWRDAGLSGDAASQRGPLAEIHDATPLSEATGALFGFVGVPAGAPQRDRTTLIDLAVRQLTSLFGSSAGNPVAVLVKDWARDPHTATVADAAASGHPLYGMPRAIAELADEGLTIISAEMSAQFGGLLEGALEVSEIAARRLLGTAGQD